MKKYLKVLLVLMILAAGGFFGYQYYTSHNAAATQVIDETQYTQHTIAKGDLSKVVKGTGTLSTNQKEDVTLDYAVTVSEVLVNAGEVVTRGQALLEIDTDALKATINTLQTDLDTCESNMAAISGSYSSTSYIRMPQDARVKEVYLRAGQYVQNVMAEKGCIALLSLDGRMAVETNAVEGMAVTSTVEVKVGRTTLDGTVRAIENGRATVTFSDAYGAEGQEVELSYGKTALSTAVAHISMPYQLTATERGYVSAVYMEKNERKWQNNKIAYLINVPVSEEYRTLQATREKLAARLNTLKAVLAAGTIDAPSAGIVASMTTASATAQEARAPLASLYVGEEKEMVVSVDELDIINVAVGQNAEIAMDAITDKTYCATVSRVSQIGTAASGVTVYDVVLTITGDGQLKLGMNGTATIKVKEVNDVLLVPISAMNTARSGSYVWVQGASANAADTGEPGVKTTIETGLSDDSYAEVTSGLNEGDVVLITRSASISTDKGGSGTGDGMIMDMGGGMPAGGDIPGFQGAGTGNGARKTGN